MDSYFKNRRICFLGDSITEGIGVNPDKRYFDILAEKLGFEAHGYGVNGSKYIGLLGQAEKMHEDFGGDVDAIFLFAGTNDYNGNTPLGSWFSEMVEPFETNRDENGITSRTALFKKRNFDMNPGTFRGSINTVLSYIKHNYAEKQIVLMTPLHRAYSFFDNNNIQRDELYSNEIGYFTDDYAEDVRRASEIWSTELIDLNRISGLFPLFDESAVYFANEDTDRLHPGRRGHERLAEVIGRKLQSIALF